MLTRSPDQTQRNRKHPAWLEQIEKTSQPLPHQGHFCIEGLKIDIHAYDPETYHWLEKYIYSLNLLNSSKATLTYRINTLHSDALVQFVLSSIENTEVDTHKISNTRRHLNRVSIDKYITIDCDPAYGMLWVTNRLTRTITLVLSTKVRWPFLEISRVTRDLITRFFEDQGWILFHAGAIHTNDKNYLIVGDASAGKIYLIIALLTSGSSFISNERVFVKIKDNAARMLSFPTPIAVGLGTLVQYPELIKFIRQPQLCQYPPRRINFSKVLNTAERKWPTLKDKIQFLPQEITAPLSNAEGIPGGIVHGLIVPSWKKNRSVKLESLENNKIENVLKNNCIDRRHDDIYPPWMPLPFQQPTADEKKNTVSYLMDLPGIKFTFSGDKHRKNETATYSKRLDDRYSSTEDN